MVESSVKIPSDVTFEQAIALSYYVVEKMEAGEISPSEIETVVSELAKTENGARGFFVTYLTSEATAGDNPTEEVVRALRSHPDTVSELLAKNVAMSAATALSHRRNGNEEMAKSSERVCDRTSHLIKLIDIPEVYSCCREILKSATNEAGKYKSFLERWGYDSEQRQLISQALQKVVPE
ncbi:hypothetical protein H6S82_29790 [Planktothrix sp. FACHB-1355]|uniref:Uncharacterized protein n=1 Tax=Aerosakkonema funiforme FACHB-1375 TaxID=2949571 RepID=A0A926ZI56_9CYAN|nr:MULTISPECIES: hypothetical protein [Oscillatoriales]MBD2181446.1 hypothetical protein [Aerosakkonema funiforme FACHB-1375]MBD3563002.1 hypothetical protein [Planktothrix sp. FACHB-1355]